MRAVRGERVREKKRGSDTKKKKTGREREKESLPRSQMTLKGLSGPEPSGSIVASSLPSKLE